jgi:hypothetical protein
MYRLIITRVANGWFSHETQAEVIINVHVTTNPASTQQLTFPLSTKVNIDRYHAGQISLPVEYTVVNGLPLTQKDAKGADVTYSGFAVDTTLVNLRSRSGMGTALDALQKITGSGKIPIPSSPYTQTAGYLLDFANTAVSADIDNKNADDKFATASLTLNIDPVAETGGNCRGFEQTGFKTIIMAEGDAASGTLIPLADVPSYCWAADIAPAFVVKATRKEGATSCDDPSYNAKYMPIGNNYVAYYLQRRPIISPPNHLGPPTEADKRARRADQAAKQGARKLCAALHVMTCRAAE